MVCGCELDLQWTFEFEPEQIFELDHPLTISEGASLNDVIMNKRVQFEAFRPKPPPGYFCLGDYFYCRRLHKAPVNPVLCVRPCIHGNAGNAVPPNDIEFIWYDKGSGSSGRCNLYRMIPPQGYRVIGGIIAINNRSEGSARAIMNNYRCIAEDRLAADGVTLLKNLLPIISNPDQEGCRPIWTDQKSKAKRDVTAISVPLSGLWSIKSGYDKFADGSVFSFNKEVVLDILQLNFPLNSIFHSADERAKLLKDFAPQFVFDRLEEFWPCSFSYFLDPARMKREWRFEDGQFAYSLTTRTPVDGVSVLQLPFIRGPPLQTDPADPNKILGHRDMKIVASIVEKEAGVVDLVYSAFFPFNQGKEIAGHVVDNHVSDAEHVTIRLVHDGLGNLVPRFVLYSSHHLEFVYPWSSPELRKQGNHIVAFCAKGSHGFWTTPESHIYLNVPVVGRWINIYDICSNGRYWNTWEGDSLDMFVYTPADTFSTGAVPTGHELRPALQGFIEADLPPWMKLDYKVQVVPIPNGPDPSNPATGSFYRCGNVELPDHNPIAAIVGQNNFRNGCKSIPGLAPFKDLTYLN